MLHTLETQRLELQSSKGRVWERSAGIYFLSDRATALSRTEEAIAKAKPPSVKPKPAKSALKKSDGGA